eukprot:scaffold41220_cov71-Phaeocystis_antarctica.AAC.23
MQHAASSTVPLEVSCCSSSRARLPVASLEVCTERGCIAPSTTHDDVEWKAPISSTTDVTRPAAMAASSGVRATHSAGAPSPSKTSSVVRQRLAAVAVAASVISSGVSRGCTRSFCSPCSHSCWKRRSAISPAPALCNRFTCSSGCAHPMPSISTVQHHRPSASLYAPMADG